MQRLTLFLLCILSVRVSQAEDADATRIRRQIESTPMTHKVTLSNDQWRKVLAPGQFQVLREAKTDAPRDSMIPKKNKHQAAGRTLKTERAEQKISEIVVCRKSGDVMVLQNSAQNSAEADAKKHCGAILEHSHWLPRFD